MFASPGVAGPAVSCAGYLLRWVSAGPGLATPDAAAGCFAGCAHNGRRALFCYGPLTIVERGRGMPANNVPRLFPHKEFF